VTAPSDARTDIAALSASAVAVSVSLAVNPDEYSIVNLVVSITLFLVIVGYAGRERRVLVRSLALGAPLGLALLPGVGFFDEAARAADVLAFLRSGGGGDVPSNVPNIDLATGWLGCSAVAAVLDRLAQRARWTD
jgi:hypothetical protein